MAQPADPPPQFNFVVEIDGLAVVGFLELALVWLADCRKSTDQAFG